MVRCEFLNAHLLVGSESLLCWDGFCVSSLERLQGGNSEDSRRGLGAKSSLARGINIMKGGGEVSLVDGDGNLRDI